MNVYQLVTHKEKDVKMVLEQVAQQDFKSIVVVGINKDNTSHFFKTVDSTIHLIGVIESAKMFVYENWGSIE